MGMVGSAKLTAESVTAAIVDVTTNQLILASVEQAAKQVKSENGLSNTVNFIDNMVTNFVYPWPTNK
jgi:UDP:flavonoid glycosyltransferase YjiC (YdhE family)